MYTVLGASGHTGRVVAETLLAKGEKVRVVGRSKERLANLVNRGAEAVQAEQTDALALTRAFDGARGVYFVVPPDMQSSDYKGHQRKIVEAGAKALEAARVRHVVTLSSIGADQRSGSGPIAGLHDMETRLGKIPGLHALHLRAGYFMENLLAQAPVIQKMQTAAGPIHGDLRLQMIATRDIGNAAAQALLQLDFTGQRTHELHGQRDVSYSEAAGVIGNAIGKPALGYQELSQEETMQAMTAMGASRSMAELIAEMAAGLNEGRLKPLQPRSPSNTTPTSIETFVKEVFVPAFRGTAASA